jgi:hypothetical protein
MCPWSHLYVSDTGVLRPCLLRLHDGTGVAQFRFGEMAVSLSRLVPYEPSLLNVCFTSRFDRSCVDDHEFALYGSLPPVFITEDIARAFHQIATDPITTRQFEIVMALRRPGDPLLPVVPETFSTSWSFLGHFGSAAPPLPAPSDSDSYASDTDPDMPVLGTDSDSDVSADLGDYPWANQIDSDSDSGYECGPDEQLLPALGCGCVNAEHFGGCVSAVHEYHCVDCTTLLGCQCDCEPCIRGHAHVVAVRATEFELGLPRYYLNRNRWLFMQSVSYFLLASTAGRGFDTWKAQALSARPSQVPSHANSAPSNDSSPDFPLGPASTGPC